MSALKYDLPGAQAKDIPKLIFYVPLFRSRRHPSAGGARPVFRSLAGSGQFQKLTMIPVPWKVHVLGLETFWIPQPLLNPQLDGNGVPQTSTLPGDGQ